MKGFKGTGGDIYELENHLMTESINFDIHPTPFSSFPQPPHLIPPTPSPLNARPQPFVISITLSRFLWVGGGLGAKELPPSPHRLHFSWFGGGGEEGEGKCLVIYTYILLSVHFVMEKNILFFYLFSSFFTIFFLQESWNKTLYGPCAKYTK